VSDREARFAAADAARLKEDPALASILRDLEAHAVSVAVADFQHETRERARYLALAIQSLRQEIIDRIDTILVQEHVRQRERASE
jgi:cell division GTPase FtsZ